MKKFFLSVVLLLPLSSAYSQITLTSATAAAAIDSFIGTGVTATNITYSGNTNSLGVFSGNSNLGITNGITFGTGSISHITDPATYHHSEWPDGPGDPDLQALLGPIATGSPASIDAAVLEFDFTSLSDSVSFEYVFGSEEYNDYVPTAANPQPFNDIFAFFVSGPGIVGQQNIALVPGTTLPVAIATINNGNSGGVATGPCMNCSYYYDNYQHASPTVCMDGFTTVLKAKMGVKVCATYHMKLAISNAGDGAFDSQVFLRANSFSASYVNIYPSGGGVYWPNQTSTLCQGDSILLTASNAVNWTWNTGATTQSLWVNNSNAGQYSVIVYGVGNPCFLFSAPYNIVNDIPIATINPAGLVTLCPGDTAVLTANSGSSYLWSNGSTNQFISVLGSGTFTVTVTDTAGCKASSLPVTVNAGVATATITPIGPTAICLGGAVTLSANNGSNFLWSNGATTQNITTSVAGNYTVTVTQAAGCFATSAPQNIVVSIPTASIVAGGPTTFCQGGNVTLTANAGSSYMWSNGATTQSISPATTGSYIVTVTNASGCDTASTAVSVTVNSAVATITTAGSLTLCPGQTASLTANTGLSYLWSNGATTQAINPSVAGNYTVVVTNLNNCTATSASVAVAVSNPISTITPAGSTTLCPGNSVALNANPGSSYLWSNGATTASITVSSAGNYTVTVSDVNNCSAVSTPVSVSITAPVATITPGGPTTFCQGGNVALNANSGSSYLWSTGATTQSITASATGSFIVTVTNANGCDTASLPVNITVNTATANITAGGSTTICPGSQVNLAANTGSSYQWSTGATTQSINANATGSYTVTVTNLNGCTATATPVAVTVSNPTAVITPAGSTTLCPGGSVVLNANSGISYLWSNGSTASSVTASANGNFTVTVTNSDNCTAVSLVVSVVVSAPTATITPGSSTTFCQGDSVVLSANSGNNYLWSNGSTTGNITITSSGTYAVTVTNTDGCTALSANVPVVVNTSSATITANGNTVFCSNGQVILQANTGVTYLWNTGSTLQNLTVNQAGSFFATVTDVNGCTAVSNSISTLVSLPVAQITASGPTTICPNTTIDLTANGGANYLWSDGSTTQVISVGQNGTFMATVTDSIGCTATSNTISVLVSIPQAAITPAGPTTFCDGSSVIMQANSGSVYVWSDGSTSQQLTVTQAGNYTVEVTDSVGCKETSAILSVTVLFATATATAQGTTVFCEGATVSIIANNGLAYLWNTGASTQSIIALTSGNYFVTVTNNNGCTAVSPAVLVDVHAYPVIKFASDTSLICETLKVKFTNQSTYETGSVFDWDFGDGVTSADENPSHVYTVAGTYPVTLTITSPVSCISTKTEDVTVIYYPPPRANFKADPAITTLVNSLITLQDLSLNAVRWHWDFGDGTTSLLQNPEHFYSQEGRYKITLRVHSLADCEDELSDFIYISPFFIPNSFTPNNDGKNDVFFDANHELNIEKYQMIVWNRWGEKVYVCDSYSKPWDGTDKAGNPAPQGNYIYYISVNTKSGKLLEYKGNLNLIR